ncbi:MAG: DUF3459 domain-containing protein, partial [Pseudomonadota bacterium]
GEELGLPQAEVAFDRLQDPEALANWPKTLGRDGARTPMPWAKNETHAGFSNVEPWLPLDHRHTALAIDQQTGQPGSVLEFHRSMIALRSGTKALQDGDIKFLDAPEDICAFVRSSGAEELLVVINLSQDEQHWSAPKEPMHIVLTTQDGISFDSKAALPPLFGYVAKL